MFLLLESTLKRHGYYCRSRSASKAPRARSCIFCVKAKARCDSERPSCSRCIHRGHSCEYPSNTARATQSGAEAQAQCTTSDASTKPVAGPPMPAVIATDNALNPSTSALSDTVLYDVLFAPDNGIQHIGVGDDGWDGLGWSSSVYSQPPHTAFLTPTTLMNSEASLSDESFIMQRAMFSPKPQILRMPTYTMRSLFQRLQTDSGNQRISQLMLQTLKSYPLMMLRQKTPPPFIHSLIMVSDAGSNDAEPWHNCVSLMHMIDRGIQGSRKLFWRNVRTECERFCHEVYYTGAASVG